MVPTAAAGRRALAPRVAIRHVQQQTLALRRLLAPLAVVDYATVVVEAAGERPPALPRFSPGLADGSADAVQVVSSASPRAHGRTRCPLGCCGSWARGQASARRRSISNRIVAVVHIGLQLVCFLCGLPGVRGLGAGGCRSSRMCRRCVLFVLRGVSSIAGRWRHVDAEFGMDCARVVHHSIGCALELGTGYGMLFVACRRGMFLVCGVVPSVFAGFWRFLHVAVVCGMECAPMLVKGIGTVLMLLWAAEAGK
ncbi:unnamed protein product [Prorocentrum cordatum]|uniref:Transmembrane protein 107 n=1 Tax=Prorocentrum cordatum TaxID=2364126 RepID=A0ABN9VKJ5_9DINO|nr:unnamed protein product [Polarella glacialis]